MSRFDYSTGARQIIENQFNYFTSVPILPGGSHACAYVNKQSTAPQPGMYNYCFGINPVGSIDDDRWLASPIWCRRKHIYSAPKVEIGFIEEP